ncbi:MAG: DUF3169 family protein [Bacillota bacterium]
MNKKYILKMLGLLILGAIFGFLSATFLSKLDNNFFIIIDNNISNFIIDYKIYLFIILIFIFFLPTLYFYNKAKKDLLTVNDLSDDEYYDKMILGQKNINKGLFLNILFIVMNFLLLGLVYNYDLKNILVVSVLFLINILMASFLEISAVNFLKSINPHLKGDPTSLSFDKVFFKSCDEAEKESIYKSSRFAYQFSKISGIALLVVTLLAQMFFKTGFFPISISAIYFILLIGSYSYYLIYKTN